MRLDVKFSAHRGAQKLSAAKCQPTCTNPTTQPSLFHSKCRSRVLGHRSSAGQAIHGKRTERPWAISYGTILSPCSLGREQEILGIHPICAAEKAAIAERA